MSDNFWRRCSSCKTEISFNTPYYVCSVSTCRQKRTDYVFCKLECWDRHIPVERHRSDNVSAIEKTAPKPGEGSPRRVVVTASGSTPQSFHAKESSSKKDSGGSSSMEGQVLVVASKVKKYINDTSRMNTSASTMDALSTCIRKICDKAILNAQADGRKTVMDRDVPHILL